MITIKLSYSIIDAWMRGQYEQAIGYYIGQALPPTPQMELGKAYDEMWEAHIKQYGTLPDELGGGILTNPQPQTKYQKVIPLDDKYQILFRGVPDCPDNEICYEFKCGLTEATSYVDGWQADAYKLLRPQFTQANYLCYNPYFNTLTKGIKYLDDSNAEHALENIITYGTEIIDYLIANRLVRNYKM